MLTDTPRTRESRLCLQGQRTGSRDHYTFALRLEAPTFGTDFQKNKYLPRICKGEDIWAQAITEADAGSDVLSMRTKARKENGGYIINGTKMFISNGPVADCVSVFAATNPGERRLSRASRRS